MNTPPRCMCCDEPSFAYFAHISTVEHAPGDKREEWIYHGVCEDHQSVMDIQMTIRPPAS